MLQTIGLCRASLIFALVSLGTACSKDASDPLQQIRTMLETTETAIQDRDVSAVRDVVSENYHDARGNDKERLINTLRLYLLRGGSLQLLVTVDDIEVFGDDAAEVQLQVRFAEADLSRLSLDAGDYQFALELAREGPSDWQVLAARWARSGETLR